MVGSLLRNQQGQYTMTKYHIDFYYKDSKAGNGFEVEANNKEIAMKIADKLIRSFSVNVPENWSRFDATLVKINGYEPVANEYSVRPAPRLHCN